MQLKTIALLGAGFSVIESVMGASFILFNAISLPLVGLHVVVAIIILILSIQSLRISSTGIERRLARGCLILTVILIILGFTIHSFNSPILLIIHIIITLGLLSDFSVLYGMELTK